MATRTDQTAKVRVQVDLSETEAKLLQHLASRLSVRSRADLLQQAYGAFLWLLNERLAGRRIISVAPDHLEQIDRYNRVERSGSRAPAL